MASINPRNGEIHFDDGRKLFVDTVINGKDYIELAQLLPKLVPILGRAGLVGFPFGGGGGGGGGPGTPGAAGSQGLTGIQGATGPSAGAQGVTGLPGPTGVQGATGIQGATGVQGATGLRGATGLQGATGIQGVTGIQGTTGVQGATGVQGVTGIRGVTGIQGITGPAVSPASQISEATSAQSVAATYAVLPSMTITPAAGTYLVWFRGTFTNIGVGGGQLDVRIRSGATPVAASVSSITLPALVTIFVGVVTIARVTVNGAEAIDVQAQQTVSTDVHERQLMIELAS